MERAGKALASIGNALSKLRIMAPWRITGVASDAEFKEYLPAAGDFRAVAPMSQTVRAVIPHADLNHVYDIKYYTRDTRRRQQVVGGVNQTEVVSLKLDVSGPAKRPEGLPPTPGHRHKFSKPIGYLEVANSGYT